MDACEVDERSVYRVAMMELDLEARVLTGPRGSVRLASIPFALAERLMRSPGLVISRSALIAAMYPNPDDEPETAENVLRNTLSKLRGMLCLLGGEDLRIVVEPSEGWVLMSRRSSL